MEVKEEVWGQSLCLIKNTFSKIIIIYTILCLVLYSSIVRLAFVSVISRVSVI